VGHRLRAEADGVVVGSGTVRADDPELSVRHVSGPSPTKIVLDSDLSIEPDARVYDGEPLVLACLDTVSDEAAEEREGAGVQVWRLPALDGRPDLGALLDRAGDASMIALLIEGGGQVAASALKAGLVDRVAVFLAPRLLGGGVPSIADLGIGRVADAVRLTEVAVEQVGEDLLYTASVAT